MKRKVRASLTVEASFVVTMTMLVLGILLSLWIYKFQICWYTQSVSECLLTGSNQLILETDDALERIKTKWEQVKDGNCLQAQDLKVQIDVTEKEILMILTGNISLLGKDILSLEIEQKVSIIKPVSFIRKVQILKVVKS